jgi:hypothetical protein
MRGASFDLTLTHLDIILGGEKILPLEKRVKAVAMSSLLDGLEPLR